jgi:hypothetical protein
MKGLLMKEEGLSIKRTHSLALLSTSIFIKINISYIFLVFNGYCWPKHMLTL